ncbi:MAG: DUF3365 domain-containing protein [Desulfobacteraceae bacterium]|nr:DUF3365 domain-containing protein [Desulfobacteraceae bacterium]
MGRWYSHKKNWTRFYRNMFIMVMIWMLVVGGFLVVHIRHERLASLELLKNEARATLNKDLAIRLWATSHGGVYVPPDRRTPPNPYLKHVERDIETRSGKKLTLLNPAYALRQIMDEYEKLFGVKGKITSLKFLNPINAPDEWESKVLKSFEENAEEYSEMVDVDGIPHMRLMRPLIVKEGCLKCHGYQGYEVGDIRGGIGVFIPVGKYDLIRKNKMLLEMAGYGIVFIIGVFVLGLFSFRKLQQIEERRRARKEILQSEEKYRSLTDDVLENLMVGVFILDKDFSIVWINRSMEFYFGIKRDDVIGKNNKELMETSIQWLFDDPERFLKNVLAFYAGDADLASFKCHVLCDGTREERWLEYRSQSIASGFYAGGRIEYYTDITSQRNAEQERLRLFTAIDQAYETVVITDKKGTIQFANPAFERTTGYSQKEAIGLNPRVIQSGQHDAKFYHELWDTLSSGRSWRGHFINKRKDGSIFEEEASITPIKNDEGEITNYVAVKRDVTRELEIESQLRQSQKMESLGLLAGGIAHDFNNILGIIIGYSDIIRVDLSPGAEHVKELGEIIKAANRAKDLVSQILAFSRQSKKQFVPIQPNWIIKEVLKMLRASIPTTIKIAQDIPKCGTILGDPTQLHQIVLNLCTNAYHAMRESGGVLDIKLQSLLPGESDMMISSFALAPGSYILLEIGDTGVGMTKSLQDKIFDPYFTTKKRGEGTGLGLSVVHGLVKNFGGHISVTSEPGKGSIFRICFPQLKQDILIPPPPEQEILPGGNEKILIVDDEASIARMEAIMLESLGYKVSSYTSSIKALNAFLLEPEGFDLVVTDMTMPDMNGVELMRSMQEQRQDIPVILCTGFSDLVDKEKARSMGVGGYLVKPILKGDLAKAVRKVLDKFNG